MFEQERVIGRLQRRVLGDPAIVACFLSGSYGRGTDDGYSDLDVGLVFADDADRDRAWEQRDDFAQSVMPYVTIKAFDAEHVRPFFHICLLANGSKIDYRYESAATIEAGPWDSRIRILKDSDGWADAYQADCVTRSWPRPTVVDAELNQIDQRFWVMFWDALRLLARGDTDKPFTIYLELLSFSLPPLLALLIEDDAARQGLIKAGYSRDAEATIQQLDALLDAYLVARTAIVQRYHLHGIGNEAFESELRRNFQKLT